MKKSLLVGVSLATMSCVTAQAADLGTRPVYKAPALAPAPWSWTGFYIGGNVGAAWAHSSVADDPASNVHWLFGATTDLNSTGVIGGLQVGYNYQISSLVLGIEGDISFASLDDDTQVTSASGSDTFRSKFSTLGTVRGRIGWAFDRALIYGTGGVAFARVKNELFDPFFFTASTDSNMTGWTAGGGIEYAFADHWTAKAEYLHVGFDDRHVAAPNGYLFVFKDSLDIARVGINYKF